MLFNILEYKDGVIVLEKMDWKNLVCMELGVKCIL